MTAAARRATCDACGRPAAVCYCAHVTPIATRTRVVILQHPRESDVSINTARIAALCLPEAEIAVGVCFEGSDVLARALSDEARPAALLYPSPDAIDVVADPPPGPITLVVLDGTWWQAKKLLRENPTLRALPRYALRPPRASEYRIRREPHVDYVSTIEALAYVLGALEGDPRRFQAMLAPFRVMVETQLAFAAKAATPRRLARPRRKPRDPRSRLPPLLLERLDDLLCVHAEADSWPFGSAERAAGRDVLVQWSACRVATGEVFERFVAPDHALSPNTAHHLEVDPRTILAGGSARELLDAWAAFVRPSDVICSWGGHAPWLFERAGGSLPPAFVDLRRASRIFALAKVGTAETFLGRLGVTDVARVAASGRAGRRLGELVALCRALTTGGQRG